MVKDKSERTSDDVLMEVCEYYYRHSESKYFNKSDVCPVADLIRAGLIEMQEDEEGHKLFPTDVGLLRYHSWKVAEYQKKVTAPRAEAA